VFHFARRALVGIGVAVVMVLPPGPAGAVPGADGTVQQLAGVGSDTIFDVLNPIATKYSKNAANTNNTDLDKVKNVPPVLAPGATYTVPADADCGKVVYDGNGVNPPPNGSSAGINALINDTSGCVDFARSSRGRSGTDPATLEFYAFAKDAVTWGRWSVSCPGGDNGTPVGCAPLNLTQQQIKDIYNCDPSTGQPAITNWSQVGGDNSPIIRYAAQPGSGTRSFFDSKILGGGSSDDPDCTTRSVLVQENNGNQIAAADQPAAIVAYSFGQWTAQANAVIPDVRAGVELGRINGVKPSNSTINGGSFLGRRWVYLVAKTTTPSYGQVLRFAGVDASGNGYVCGGGANKLIKKYGFVANSLAPAGPGLPNSYCRKEPAPL
jgi:phosphate transport system substrate-binding protein